MGYRDLVYRLYERRLESSLTGKTMPRHVGVMTDGNRRWARSAGHTDVSKGHRKGADKIFELLASGASRPGSRWSPSGCCPPTT